MLIEEFESFKELLKRTFNKIKTDISINEKEIERLHTYNRKLEMELMQLKHQIGANSSHSMNLPNSNRQNDNPPNSNYPNSNHPNSNHQNSVENKDILMGKMSNKIQELEQNLSLVKNQVESKQISMINQDPLINQILRKVGRNKKSYIKKQIIQIASSRDITLPELKEIFVNDQKLCSKATIYRYVEDLKLKGKLNIIEIDDVKIIVPSKNIETSLK